MKPIYFVVAALLCTQLTTAQIKLTPQWRPGNTETLELTHAMQKTAKGVVEKDSGYALIEQVALGEDAGKTYFVWNIKSYYRDTTQLSSKSKLVARYAMAFAGRCPIHFSVSKTSYDVSLENEQEIDSLANVIADEFVAASPQKKKEEIEVMKELLLLTIQVEIGKRFADWPAKYYKVYAEGVFSVGVKADMADPGGATQLPGLKGYTIWDEAKPGVYHKYGEGMASLAGMNMRVSMDAWVDKATARVTGYASGMFASGTVMGESIAETQREQLKKVEE